jgi:hypothetical protein
MGARFALFPIARKRVLGGGRAHWEEGVRALLPTSPRYKQFGTKLSPIFGFAKSSKYKPIFPLSQMPKLLVACVGGSVFYLFKPYSFSMSIL